jgi:ubiquitin-protein ligase
MATNRSFAKDFHNLLRNISSISGGQACISDWDDDDVSKFDVEISPSDGLYKGGKFKFQVRISNRLRERPFNLKGGYVFFSKKIF